MTKIRNAAAEGEAAGAMARTATDNAGTSVG